MNVAGSWSTSRLVCTKLANERWNRQLKLTRALAAQPCKRTREPTAKAMLGFSAVQPCKRTREPTAKAKSGFSAAQPCKRMREPTAKSHSCFSAAQRGNRPNV